MTAARPAILIALLAQLATAFADMAVPILAPVVTESAGLAPETIGYFSSLVSAGTLVFLVAGGDATRWMSAGRLLLWGTLISGIALALIALDSWPLLLLAALVLGLSYGPNMPAASELIAEMVPEGRRGLAFSIKQSGVPAAGSLAGLSLPLLALALGWQAALLAAAGGVILCGLVIARMLGRLESQSPRGPRAAAGDLLTWRRLSSPVASLALAPSLPAIAYSGAVFAAVQGSVVAFLVTYLVDQLGISLAIAGSLFVVFHVIGIPGRLLAGVLADRINSARRGLLILALAGAATILILLMVTPDWPIAAIYAVAAGLGLVIGSWNGLILAEVSQVVDSGNTGPATAGAGFFTFLGFILGPSAFALAISLVGYHLSLAALAVVALTPVVALALAPNARERP